MLRFTTADKGRRATLTVDSRKVADITIPASVANADANGFYNVEYAIPASVAKGKKKLVVKLTASPSTFCPGLYYMRLMKPADQQDTRVSAQILGPKGLKGVYALDGRPVALGKAGKGIYIVEGKKTIL